jgi:hypothetical protein
MTTNDGLFKAILASPNIRPISQREAFRLRANSVAALKRRRASGTPSKNNQTNPG